MACSRNSPRSAICSNSSLARNLYSRPSISLPRRARVVADTESAILESSAINFFASVDFPAPDGLDSVNIKPRRAPCSFNIGGLLLDLVHRCFQIERDAREVEIGRLRTQRVGLARQLLAQKIQPPPRRLRLLQQRAQLRRVRHQPLQFFRYI